MGKGDPRSRKGKLFNGSYGKTRPHQSPKKANNTNNTENKNESNA